MRTPWHPLYRWLAGTLVAALACSAAPSPAYALRAVGLEEGSARNEVVQALGGPSISPTTATARAAGQEETIEALVVPFRPSPTGDPILNPAELPDAVRERIVNYLRAEFEAGRQVMIWWKLDLQLALAQRFNRDESAVLTADGSEVSLKHVSRIVPLGRYFEILRADRIRGRAVKVDFQKNDGTDSVTRATLKAFDPDSEDHGYRFPRPQPGAIWLSYAQDDYKATHGLNDKGDGENPTVWLPERVPLALVVRIQVGRAPVSGPLGVMPTAGLEETSPYDPSIRDRSARHHPLDLGRRGRHEATEDEARFIRDFIRERMLETGRVNRDRTMKSYLRYLVGAHRGRSSQEASAIGLTRIRQRLYVDSFGYLRAFGTASGDGTEQFSLARELLEDAQRALAAGRTDADAVERLTEVLFHEINHVLDVRYGRLASWLRTIQIAWGHSPEKRERWERHIKEMSAIGRTANVMDGVYVPDSENLAGGAFLYRYRNHNRAVESFATDQFPYSPSETEFVAVPLDAKGTSKPWAMYRERADQFFARQVSGAAAGLEEGWVEQVERALAAYDNAAQGVTNAPALTSVRQALAQRDPAGVRQALETIQPRIRPSSVGMIKSHLLGMAVTLALKALPDSPENLALQARRILNAVDAYEGFVQQHTTEYPSAFPLLADVREALAKTPPDFAAARAAADRAHEAIRTAVQVLPPDVPAAPTAIQNPELRAAIQRALEQIDATHFDSIRALVQRQLQGVLDQFPPSAAGMEETPAQAIAGLVNDVFPDGQLTGAALLARAQQADEGRVFEAVRDIYRMRVIANEPMPELGIRSPMATIELTRAGPGADARRTRWTPQETTVLDSYHWQWHRASAKPKPRDWESGMVQHQEVWSVEFVMDGAAGLADIVLAVKPPAAGIEEPVMIPPESQNPFKDEVEQPDYVMDRLLVYYTPPAETFARSLAPTQHARVIVEVPLNHSEMADYSVMITAPGEVSEAEKAILRQRHIAIIERQDGMTVEQVIQEALAQWEGRTVEEISQVVRITYKDGRLGIYL